MAFDGVVLNGQSVKLRRPKDYAPLPGSLETAAGADSITRLHVAGLPHSLTEDQIRELLSPFGNIRELTPIKDPVTGDFKVALRACVLTGRAMHTWSTRLPSSPSRPSSDSTRLKSAESR